MHHVPYYDVQMPKGAQDLVWENLWAMPSALAAKVQEEFGQVSAAQVYRTWVAFSETMWKRANNQMESAKMLLEEMKNEADILPIETVLGVMALAWGIQKTAAWLKGQIVEVVIDAMYNTNAKALELYAVMGEHDNIGIPLAYCLLSTANSITPGK
ncbi:hypothetical protein K439DRAFT_1613256 [Ramaria rubella]|nr:hypothetical protein K439DRAFT_1613256 [Ramaria rubella]